MDEPQHNRLLLMPLIFFTFPPLTIYLNLHACEIPNLKSNSYEPLVVLRTLIHSEISQYWRRVFDEFSRPGMWKVW